MRSCDGGATFSPIIDLLDSLGIGFKPSNYRLISNKKMVCVLFNLGGFGSPVYMLRSYDRGTSWSGPTPIVVTDSITQMQGAAIFGDTILVSVSDYSHIEYLCALH